MFNLKRFRKDFGLTQKETAFILECGQPNIVAIEKNNKDLTPKQFLTLQEKYGNLENYIVCTDTTNYNINDITEELNDSIEDQNDSIEVETEKWYKLVEKHQETIERLLSIIENEKQEKLKLLETINTLGSLLVEKKAV